MRPIEEKKGADTGIDGLKFFRDVDKKDVHKIVVSVKGGENLKADDVCAVNHVRDREKADIALFISLTEPTSGMRADAAAAGLYTSPNGKKFARVQLLTVTGLLDGTQRAEHPDSEPDLNFNKARTESAGEQAALFQAAAAIARKAAGSRLGSGCTCPLTVSTRGCPAVCPIAPSRRDAAT